MVSTTYRHTSLVCNRLFLNEKKRGRARIPWRILNIDFYHAAGHLDTALAAAYGDTHPKRRAQFEKQRHVLKTTRAWRK